MVMVCRLGACVFVIGSIVKETFKVVKKSITKAIKEFVDLDKEALVNNRMEKFSNMGVVKE